MTKILYSKNVVDNKINYLKSKCLELSNLGLRPKMQVVLVGNNPASLIYVRNKELMCQKVGAEFVLKKLDSDVSVEKFLETIEEMNKDSSITGCFVQLPIPKQLQSIDVTSLINPEKDVDGFGINSIVSLYKNSNESFIPCTPKGILTLINYYNLEIESKHVVIIGRSLIVGRPLSLLLTNLNATVTLCHSKTINLPAITRNADIIISAIGNSKFLTTNYFKSDKSQVVIDVGISNDENKKLTGDVDFEHVKNNVKAITPVPGGVGPMTVLSLIENLVLATEKIIENKKESKNE